jgi:metal-responsive CopG/Arc/MetJ family transcriptional regulator
MKTAISLPDELFERAEAAAKKLRVSRSKLYARALEKMLKEMDDKEITRRLNKVYAKVDSRLDPALARLQWASLEKEEW